eukprot:5881111-Karenia_brevis.AAC.1
MKRSSYANLPHPTRLSSRKNSGTRTGRHPKASSPQLSARRGSGGGVQGVRRSRASCRRNSTEEALVLGAHEREAHPRHSKGVAVVVHGCRRESGHFQ